MGKRVVKRQTVTRSTAPSKANEAADLTDDVAAGRRQKLADNYPKLERSDFASEEEYRNALLAQYRQLRQEEYENICLSEGTGAFNEAVRYGGNMNQNIYNKQKGMASDSLAYRKIAEGDIVRNPAKYRGSFCCAISACAVEAAICERMGVDGLVKCDSDNMGAANLAPFSEELKVDGRGSKDLWKLIEEGKVGPGDQISRDSSRSNSGRHSEVIVAVNYDENGKLKNYVIQANNRTKLQVIDANTPYPPAITKKVKGRSVTREGSFTVGRMNTWMTGQLKQEAENMRSLSTAELEARIAEQKVKVNTEITNLEKVEHQLFNLHTAGASLNRMITNYADIYIKNSHVPSAIMRNDGQNAAEEAARQEARVTRRGAMFHSTTATQSRETTEVQPQAQMPAEKQVVRSDVITQADKNRMESMLKNLNKAIGKKQQFDIEATISTLAELYGSDAAKVLTKIMMAPGQIAQKLDLRDENGKPISSSRGVLSQLCSPQTEEQNQQILAIAVSQKRGRGGMV